jgi:hypothetical protein
MDKKLKAPCQDVVKYDPYEGVSDSFTENIRTAKYAKHASTALHRAIGLFATVGIELPNMGTAGIAMEEKYTNAVENALIDAGEMVSKNLTGASFDFTSIKRLLKQVL